MIATKDFEVQSWCYCNVARDFLIGSLSAAAERTEVGLGVIWRPKPLSQS
jgi:hypothetical protein